MKDIIDRLVRAAMGSQDPAAVLHASVVGMIAQGHESAVVALELQARSVHTNDKERNVIDSVLHSLVSDTADLEKRLLKDLGVAMKTEFPSEVFRDAVKDVLKEVDNRAAVALAMNQIRSSASESEENVILDVLDLLTGFCPSGNKI